ncbi:Z1 domain-containing protein [Mycoplasmoides pirum]|uniref:Z1 domain-containing protein n=1 Tax=Mycoplasmoides pirum TaxID=2122 RepID=UPI00048805B0|nr:Z1 domain-containing protein [Mycoplasmoides pirum]
MDINTDIKQLISQFNNSNHQEHFIEYCKLSGMDNESIAKIQMKAKDIIETLGNSPKGLKALLVGKVQSGKTSTFSACISQAFNKDYDIAIVLSGRDNVLNKQTFDRLKKTFTKDDFSTGVNVYQIKEIIASKDNKTFIDELHKSILNRKKTIFVSLKNQQIEKLIELLSAPIFYKTKFLIIDDEGDLASFNTSEDKSLESFTYRSIRKMIETFKQNATFISVTATPQAHILLSHHDAIKPDYIFTIDPGETYMGINEFFGRDYEKYIVEVSDDEKQAIENERESTPESFKLAIIHYLVAACLFHIENKKIQKTAMLVHTAKEILRHNMIADKINSYKKSLERFLRIEDSSESEKIIKTIKDVFYSYKPSFEWTNLFMKLFIKHLQYTSINVVNSEIDDPLYKDTPNNIVVGSAMIERGVTFQNLLTTYITNRAEDAIAIDTALQRGRWFGYRKKYAHLMRIFMLKHLFQNFKDQILKHDNNLWNILIDAEKNHLPFSKLEKKLLISSDDLIATHKVKHNRIIFNRYYAKNNLNRTSEERRYSEDIFDKVANNQFISDIQVGSGNIFRMLHNIDINQFNKIFNLPADEKQIAMALNISINNWKIFHQEILPKFNNKITIAIMDNNLAISKIRKRMIYSDGSIELFQPKNNLGNKYVGDKDWNKVEEFSNNIIFQIHNVYVESTHRLQKFIAMILPNKISTNYVSSESTKFII